MSEEPLSIYEILGKIQQSVKAPKGQYNSFGKYSYRSAEDIMEAVKPALKEFKAFITCSDEIVEVGGRNYVKATATLSTDREGRISASAYAREPETKKGMDEMQITGAASSYARKYALAGLLLLDDNKDADSVPLTNVEAEPVAEDEATKKAVMDDFLGLCKNNHLVASYVAAAYGLTKKPSVAQVIQVTDSVRNLVAANQIPLEWRVQQ